MCAWQVTCVLTWEGGWDREEQQDAQSRTQGKAWGGKESEKRRSDEHEVRRGMGVGLALAC